jgi:methionyl-tRNA formyltransferase
VPLLRPERAGDREFVEALADHAPDLGVVVAFGQFLTRRVRELPSLGYLINGHASLLPRHRGAAPIAQAILSGDRETGVAVMRVEREMDAGPVCHVERTAIAPGETAGELEARLAPLAARAIETGIARIAAGEAEWIGQDPSLVTLAPKLEREEGRLDFREAAAALALRVRAFTPRPGAFTTWGDEVLRILGAEFREGSTPDAPGTVRHGEDTLRIATGDGWLVPTRLQRPGGRALAAAEFLRGHPLPAGSRLGGTP